MRKTILACLAPRALRSLTLTVLAGSAGYVFISPAISQPEQIRAAAGRHPGFNGVPSVTAVAQNDPAKVVTIATVDFDKKNGPDVVTVQTDGMLNVLFNDGKGKLRRMYSNNSAVALNPNIVFIDDSDFNGDGYSDVVAMDTRNSAFLVFMNNGDGSFATATSIPAGSGDGATLAGGGLTVADVNGDGNPDVVTLAHAESSGSTIFRQQTFLGTGGGTFHAARAADTALPGNYSLTAGRSLATADINRDGKPDLVLQIEENSPAQAISVGVSLGNGDGTFQAIPAAEPTVSAGPQPASSLAVADVNGDGVPDAVFLAYSDQVYVALGQPDGSLQSPAAVLSNMSGAVLLTLGDIDKDGKQDLVVFGSGELGVFAGKGDGTFQSTAQYTGGYGIYQQPAPADFNGDGNLDIAWLDYTNGRIGLYFGKGNGVFAGASPFHPADADKSEWAGNIEAIAAGDFNGDRSKDILAYRWPHASAGGPADLYAGINDGTGEFSFRPALPAGRLQQLAQQYQAFVIDATPADFNNDGRPDVILRTQAGLSLLLGKQDGTLNPNPIDVAFPVALGCMPFNYLATGDVNGDGFQDIVAAYAQNNNCTPSASTPSGFFVLAGDGTGHFDAKFTPFGNALYFIRLADLNGDHKPDMVVANAISGSGFSLYSVPGNGDGTFNVAAAAIPLRDQFISNILVGDYNGDDRQDLALSTDGAVGPDGSPLPGTQGVLLLPGYGDFAFGDSTRVLPGKRSIWNGTAFSDVTGDGKPDLVFSTYAQAEPYMRNFGMIVLPNKGDGTFGPAQSELTPLTVAGQNLVVFISDFNRDGAPDVLLAGGLSSPLFLNTGGTGRHFSQPFSESAVP